MGWLFRPVSVAGWLALSLALMFCIQVFMAIDQHSHSVSDTLYGVFSYFACSFLLLDCLAIKTGGNGRAAG
jgi:peptidoglycan/LPS O-acetylase OafA/YrhL